MKKIYLLLLAFIAATVLFAACSKSDEQKEESPQTTARQADYHFAGVKMVDSPETRGVALKTKLWFPGTKISIRFLNGTEEQIAEVKRVAAEWLLYANDIEFVYITSGEALVRIAIDQTRRVSWSTTGRDCTGIEDQNKPTMNIAYSTLLTQARREGEILRTFGQMLGLELEHRHIDLVQSINLNQPIWTYLFPDIPWGTAQEYIFDPLTDLANVTQTAYDQNSIMIWGFPLGSIILNDNYPAPESFNTSLSDMDKSFIRELYSKPAVETYIVLSPLEHTVGNTGGSFPLAVKSNTTWTITAPDWCSLSASSGSNDATITVTVADNGGSTTDREGVIICTIPGGTTSICKVKQTGKLFATLSPTTFDADHMAKTFDLIVTSNTNWTLTKPDWCNLSVSSGSGNTTVKVTVTENGSTSDRQGDIVCIIAGGSTSICKVTQKGKLFVSVSPTLYETDHTAKIFDLTITSNTSWTLSSINWCSVSVASGTGNATVKVAIAENGTTIDREFLIICTIPGGSTATCRVIQKAKPFVTVSPPKYDTDKTAKTFDLIVASNTSWTLSSTNWCSVNPASGTGSATVKVMLTENTTANERKWKIEPNSNGTNFCEVIQKGDPRFSFSPTNISPPYTKETYNLAIKSNTSWKLTAPAWCTLSSTSGENDATIQVTVSENGFDERSGNIVGTYMGNLTATFPVKQAAKSWYGGTANVKVYFRNNYTQPVSVNGNYRIQLGTDEINFSCYGTIPANQSENKIQVGSGTIYHRDIKALQSITAGFSSWSAPSLPSNPTTLFSTRITGDLSGYFQSSSVSGNPAGQYNSTNVTWKSLVNVNGVATLEIVYGIGSPGEDW